MRIACSSHGGDHDFRVEEYKRPKFEVNMNPVEGTFRLNDSVTVSGQAMSFYGAGVSDAKVRYRVTRRARFPWWWRWNGGSSEVEMANGEVKADAQGNFDISFKALPDPELDPAGKPTFSYEVEVDVTDLSGETRSSQTSVRVGYVALDLSISGATTVDQAKTPTYTLYSRNLNGQPLAADLTLKVYKLQDWQRPLRKDYLGQVDTGLTTLEAHIARSPYDRTTPRTSTLIKPSAKRSSPKPTALTRAESSRLSCPSYNSPNRGRIASKSLAQTASANRCAQRKT